MTITIDLRPTKKPLSMARIGKAAWYGSLVTTVPALLHTAGAYLTRQLVFPAPDLYPGFKDQARLANFIDRYYDKILDTEITGDFIDSVAFSAQQKRSYRVMKAINEEDCKVAEGYYKQYKANKISLSQCQEKLNTLLAKYGQHYYAYNEHLIKILNESSYVIQPTNYQMSDKVNLAGVTIKARLMNEPLEYKKHIFYLMGNSEQYQDYYDQAFADITRNNDDQVAYLINPRGVGESSGSPLYAKQLVDDYVKIVVNQIQQGVPAHRIIIRTQSLGAGYGSLVVAELHKQGHKVMLEHGRSFAKTGVALDLPKAIGLPKAVSKPINAILAPIATGLTTLFGWGLNAAKAYAKIPEEYKMHFVMKAGKHKDEKADTDGVIQYPGSLHAFQKSTRVEDKAKLDDFKTALTTLLALVDTYGLGHYRLSTILADKTIVLPAEDMSKFGQIRQTLTQHFPLINKWYQLECGMALPWDLLTGQDLKILITAMDELYNNKFKLNKMVDGDHNDSLSNIKTRTGYLDSAYRCLKIVEFNGQLAQFAQQVGDQACLIKAITSADQKDKLAGSLAQDLPKVQQIMHDLVPGLADLDLSKSAISVWQNFLNSALLESIKCLGRENIPAQRLKADEYLAIKEDNHLAYHERQMQNPMTKI